MFLRGGLLVPEDGERGGLGGTDDPRGRMFKYGEERGSAVGEEHSPSCADTWRGDLN